MGLIKTSRLCLGTVYRNIYCCLGNWICRSWICRGWICRNWIWSWNRIYRCGICRSWCVRLLKHWKSELVRELEAELEGAAAGARWGLGAWYLRGAPPAQMMRYRHTSWCQTSQFWIVVDEAA